MTTIKTKGWPEKTPSLLINVFVYDFQPLEEFAEGSVKKSEAG